MTGYMEIFILMNDGCLICLERHMLLFQSCEYVCLRCSVSSTKSVIKYAFNILLPQLKLMLCCWLEAEAVWQVLNV